MKHHSKERAVRMNVAKTILNQIKAIDAYAMLAWGVKDLVYTSNGLRFRVGGLAKFKGLVHVRYDEGNDLYDVEFIKIKKGMPEVVKTVKGVFCECLVDVIDATVQ